MMMTIDDDDDDDDEEEDVAKRSGVMSLYSQKDANEEEYYRSITCTSLLIVPDAG